MPDNIDQEKTAGRSEAPWVTGAEHSPHQSHLNPLEERRLWLKSPQHDKFFSNTVILVLIYIALFIAAWVLYAIAMDAYWIRDDDDSIWELIWLVSFVAAVAAVVGALMNYNALFAQFQETIATDKVNKLEDEEERLANESKGGNFKLTTLWLVTQKRINIYHDIATKQAQSSFRVGRIVSLIGFLAVVALGLMAAFATNGTAAIAASVVGVAAAGMSGYIGATFMKAQADASAQLRQFFLQPMETARLLALERLVETLEPEHKAQAVMEIVKTMGPQGDQQADVPWVLQRLNQTGK